MLIKILIPIFAMATLGLAFGLGLAYALRIFGIKVDPIVALIISKLPGGNCGACGRAGCAAFAEALIKHKEVFSKCVVSNEETRRAIADILGVEYKSEVKTVATSLCNGGKKAKDKYSYHGIQSCKAASLVFGGYKACSFGCLGLGDCAETCPFGAISMGPDGLPIVDSNKCTACGKCVITCPKNLYTLMPINSRYYVKCSSKDPGAVVMKVCRAGCIACRKCEKACPINAVKVEFNLAVIDSKKCQSIGKCFEACPTKVIAKK